MKNNDEIKKMLDAFYEGQTSDLEENQLRDYFSQADLPEEMQHEKKAFESMFPDEKQEIPIGLEERLSCLIDNLEKEEKDKYQNKIHAKKRKLWVEISGIAASVCLLVSIGVYITNHRYSKNNSTETTVSNSYSELSPEDRRKLTEAQKALEMVSTNFNKGLESMQLVSKNF